MLIPWNHSKYLCLSSTLFFVPALYAYYCKLPMYPYINTAIALSSINYWRNPVPSMRETAVSTICHISFAYYLIEGCRHMNDDGMIISTVCLGSIMYNYAYSHFLYCCNNKNWWKFHMIFHFHVMCQQMFILYHL